MLDHKFDFKSFCVHPFVAKRHEEAVGCSLYRLAKVFQAKIASELLSINTNTCIHVYLPYQFNLMFALKVLSAIKTISYRTSITTITSDLTHI